CSLHLSRHMSIVFSLPITLHHPALHSFPTRRSSDLLGHRYRLEVDPTVGTINWVGVLGDYRRYIMPVRPFTLAARVKGRTGMMRSEEHTSELQSLAYLVCRLLLEKKKKIMINTLYYK